MVKWSSTTGPYRHIKFTYDETGRIYVVAEFTMVGTSRVGLKQVTVR